MHYALRFTACLAPSALAGISALYVTHEAWLPVLVFLAPFFFLLGVAMAGMTIMGLSQTIQPDGRSSDPTECLHR
jgi:hypothetical protein